MTKLAFVSALIFICFSVSDAYAQKSKMYGVVSSAANEPIEGAQIMVVDSRSNVVLCQTLTDRSGNFILEIDDIDPQEVLLNVSHMVYKLYSKPLIIQKDKLTIILEENQINIGSVVVEGTKKLITYNGNEIIANVKSIKNYERLNADGILSRIPGLSGEGASWKIHGQQAAIYINGVQQTIPAQALSTYLAALPAKTLSTIKINTIASGKYSSSGGAVIDIIFDTKMPDGQFFQSEAKGEASKHGLNNAGVDLFYMFKKGRTIFNTTLSYDNSQLWHNRQDSTYYSGADSYILNGSRGDGRKNSISSISNLMVDLGKGHKLDFNLFAYYDQRNATRDWQDKRTQTTIDQPWDYYNSNSIASSDMYSTTIKYTSPEERNTFFSVQYSGMYGSNGSKSDYSKLINDQYANYMISDVGMNGNTHNITLSATSKLTKKISLDYGASADFNFINDRTNYSMADTSESRSKYHGTELVQGAYFKFKYDITKRMGLNINLNYQYTQYAMDQYDAMGTQRQDYGNFTPVINYWLTIPNYRLSVDFRTFIRRANYNNLLPGVRYVNDYMYTMGNPNLIPESHYLFSVDQTFFGAVNLYLDFRKIKNKMYNIFFEDADKKVYSKWLNAADMDYLYINLSAPFRLFDGLFYGDFSGAMFVYRYTKIDPQIKMEQTNDWKANGVTFSLKLFYDITDRLTVEGSGGVQLKTKWMQSEVPFTWNASGKLSYAFMPKKQLIASVGANYTPSQTVSTIFNSNFMQIYSMTKGVRVFFSLKYQFNKGEKVERRDNTTSRDRF